MQADTQEDDAAVSALSRAFGTGDVVLFAGAGVSMGPPAGLPNWHQLRDWTLEAVANRAECLAPHLPTLIDVDMLSTPGRRGMTPELVASHISQECEGYFESLKALDEGQPNDVHLTIARLAKAGLLRAVVTTNFDVFIERALDAEGVAFDLVRDQHEFSQFPLDSREPRRFSVLKVHGCLTRPDTVIATVETQARGLADHQRIVMRCLMERNTFLYWGYSGWDLKINLDYLGAVSAQPAAPGFFWSLHRDGSFVEEASPYVTQLASLYGPRGVVAHALAPAAAAQSLQALGVPIPERLVLASGEREAWQRRRDESVRLRLRSWAEEHVSPLSAVLIFASLLEVAGRAADALLCLEHVEQQAVDQRSARLQAHACGRIAGIRLNQGLPAAALERFRQAEALARECGDSGYLASAGTGAGIALSRMGRADEALACLRQASRTLGEIGDRRGSARLLEDMGQIHSAKFQLEDGMRLFGQADRIYREVGAKQALAHCLNKQGVIHRGWGDFESATRCFQESLQIFRDVIGDVGGCAESRLFLASVDVVQGNGEAAHAELVELERIARETGSDELLRKTLTYLVLILRKRGDAPRADALEDERIRLLERARDSQGLGEALMNRSWKLSGNADAAAALEDCTKALGLFRRAKDSLRAALAHERIGVLHQEHLQQPEFAVRSFLQSISCHRAVQQDASQFIPSILSRILACRGRTPPSDAIIAVAVEREPAIAEIVQTLNDDDGSIEKIHDLVRKLHQAAHDRAQDSQACLRYLRAELPLAEAIGYDHQVANVLGDIGWAHARAGSIDEGLRWLEKATDMARSVGDTSSEVLHLANLGFALTRSGDAAGGLKRVEQALGLARSNHDDAQTLWLLTEIASFFKRARDMRAMPYLEEAIALAEARGDLLRASELHFDAGKVHWDNQQFENSLDHRLRGLRTLDLLGKPALARVLVIANLLHRNLNRPLDAVPFYVRAMVACAGLKDDVEQILEQVQQCLAAQRGRRALENPVFDALTSTCGTVEAAEAALACWSADNGLTALSKDARVASLAAAHGKTTPRGVGEVMLSSAKHLSSGGHLEAALAELEVVERIAADLGDRNWQATVLRHRGDFLRSSDRHDDSVTAYRDAENLARVMGNHAEVDRIRYALACIEESRGDMDAALEHIECALSAARECEYATGIAHDLLKRGSLLRRCGRPGPAEQCFGEAIALFDKVELPGKWLEATFMRAETLAELGRLREALEAYRLAEAAATLRGTAMARQRIQAGIARLLPLLP